MNHHTNYSKNKDMELLREVQKNTEMGMKALDALSSKVYDDDLALQLSRQSLKYSAIHNKAVNEMINVRTYPYRGSSLQDAIMTGGIHMNTLMNTSTSHIAELMIRESNRGLTQMWKSMNKNRQAEGKALEIAEEFVVFEEKNIERLKKYL